MEIVRAHMHYLGSGIPSAGMLRALAGLVVSWLFILTGSTSGQSPNPQFVVSAVHRQHVIQSKVLGEERTILVRVPINYDRTDDRLPVVYMLDAHPPQNAMMVGMLEQQFWGERSRT